MIESLYLKDFALVDELRLEFSDGLTTITGETGAGKSILLQGLGLLLGDRASRELVRTGGGQARVEGVFVPKGGSAEKIAAILDEGGVPIEDTLIISRTVTADGKSRAHVNGVAVPVATLAAIGVHTVEVSSQHQHQGLLREETHLELLDRALDPVGAQTLISYREAYDEFAEARIDVARLELMDAEAAERAQFLRFQADEIRSADLEEGEEEKLEAERNLLAHAEKLTRLYAEAEAETYTGADSALDRVGRAVRSLERATTYDENALAPLEELKRAQASLEEAGFAIRELGTSLTADPNRLEAVEDRLHLIRRLERKHGNSVAALLAKLEELEAELWEVENRQLAIDQARNRLDKAGDLVGVTGAALSEARRMAGESLAARVGFELEQLSMPRSAFIVDVDGCQPCETGCDSVRFLLAPNPGEEPKPLSRIVSGGELSRVLLAVKSALRDEELPTLIFDEVDAGIGGRVADGVGDRLLKLGTGHQVICITHLPQIAARTPSHLKVEKRTAAGRTVTEVVKLSPEERVGELARMLGGRDITDATLRHAREMAERYTA